MSNIKDQEEAQRIIKNLSGKTKFNVSKNSRALGLSRQTYQNKLDNLREQKMITNFTININPNIRPNTLKFVMLEIKTNPKEPDLVKELLRIPQLRMLDGIIGDFSLFALFIFKSPEEYFQTLNTIDKIMATSYFKKYQIIETIKVFKTNGISLRNSKMSFEEQIVHKLVDKLKEEKIDKSDKIIIKLSEEIDLNQINQKFTDIMYNAERFPGLVIRVENTNATLLIFSNGKIVITGLKNATKKELIIDKIIKSIRKTGIKLDKNNIVFICLNF